MNKRLWLVVMWLVLSVSLRAEVKVTNVAVKPRWPWNGLVDITYSIECDEKDADGKPKDVYVDFTGIDNDRNITVKMKTLTGQGAKEPVKHGGPYTVTWDMAKDDPTLNSSAFQVRIHAIAGIAPYLVVNLETWKVRYTSQLPNLDDDTCRTTELWLRQIPAGTFTMGCDKSEVGYGFMEFKKHQVTITQMFYIGVFECTQKQWELVMGDKPSYFNNATYYATRPVENVSYNTIRGTGSQAGAGWPMYGHAVDSTSFMGKLQEKTGLMFDLPTEAQWEYACRAGTTTALNSGKNLTNHYQDAAMDEVGRYGYNGGGLLNSQNCTPENGTAKVGSFLPNAWGLYDMHGNVWEWCLDWCGASVSSVAAKTDPVGPTTGSDRVKRGGSLGASAAGCRSAWRALFLDDPSYEYLDVGFRVICLPKQDLYAVVDLSGGPNAERYPVRYTDIPPNLYDDTCRTTELWLRKIPAGTFTMGCDSSEVGYYGFEFPKHQVTISKPFYIGVFECTQKQWELVMGNRPSFFNNTTYYATRPVEGVSYDMIRGTDMQAGAGWPTYGHTVDSVSFMGKLQSKTGLTFDLPTEAQWEYACRAGTTTALNSGVNLTYIYEDTAIDDVGRYWYNGGSGYSRNCSLISGSAKVGSYLPNAWGLYDMHGNACEWCLDWYSNSYKPLMEDPVGVTTGTVRVLRDGFWASYAFGCRSAMRAYRAPSDLDFDSGFRVFCFAKDDLLDCTVRSSALQVDARTSIGGRLLHGISRISSVADSENANAPLTIDGQTASGWNANAPLVDSTKMVDGWHRFVLKEESDVTVTTELYVLNDDNIVIHGGVLTANETWAADKLHIVRNWIRIPDGITLNIQANTIVKFCENTGIQVDGVLNADKVVFTSIADGTVGMVIQSDIDNLGYGYYDITGDGTKSLANCDIRYAASLFINTTWTSNQVIHIIGKLSVPTGVTLTIEAGTVVKFATGAELKADGGSIVANGVLFTHLSDDSKEAGGDTNGDGSATLPVHDAYKLTGFAPSSDCELRYITLTFDGGTISEIKVLAGNRVHKVTGNITIASGGRLVVQPGAIVKIDAGLSISVDSGGTLEAIGNRACPIVFTSIKDDAHGGDTNGDGTNTSADIGDWKYLSVCGTANLEYCTLMYGAPSNETGIVEVRSGGELTMDCCTVAHALYDGVWNWGGNLTMNNCIVTDCGNAVAPYRGTKNSFNHCVFYENSYALMYWSWWTGAPVFTNCIFKNMTVGWIESNGWDDAWWNTEYWNCLFHNDDASLLPQPVIVGFWGNIWGNPMFMNADDWNFQVRLGSPCIDAGDGSGANLPEKDYYGNPRCRNKEHVTPTGVADANGNYPDIGLFEMCDYVDSDLDIALNWVEGPTSAKAGDNIELRFQATNIGTVAATGTRRDNIYLVSKDERLGERRVFVTCGTYKRNMSPGETVTYRYTNLRIPYITPGKWAFAVFFNEERDWFEGRNIENNYLVSTEDCEITLPAFACKPNCFHGTLGSGQHVGVQLTNVPAEGAVLVVKGEGMDVTGQFGYLPEKIDQGWKSVNLGNGTVLLTIPPVVAGNDVFILLENTGNTTVSYEVNSLTGAFALFDNGATTASNSGTVTIPLYGIGLTADMDVYLKQGADRIDASSLTVAENGAVYATFDVKGAAIGGWTLYASNENGSGSLEALTLTQALKGPQWWCRMELPSAIRRGRTVVGTFIYGNSGDEDMDAPYVKIEGETGVNVRLSENDAWGKTIEFLALSGTYPVSRLKAGEERRQTFQFIQLNDNSQVNIHYEYVSQKQYEKIYDSRTQDYVMIPTPFPWETNGKLMRPDWASSEDWNAIQNRLKSAIGSSWNSCFDRMRANADYLAMLGQGTNDFGLLWQLDVREALAADNVISTLASSTDLARSGRGFSIVVSRKFGTSLKTRSHDGVLGKGWAMSYETKAVLKDEGETLMFELPFGSSYMFSKATGTWRSTVVGDKTQLEETNSAYILNYQDGSVATFAKANGLMISTRDCNSNGLDFQYNGNLLSKIIHTDGQWAKFTYKGNYVSKIEDDLGHTVTYRYNGNRLVSVTGITGLTTEYCYDNAANALKTIAYPNGTTRDYTFDDMGRVSTISRNGNQQTVAIDRGSFGNYAVIDSDGGVFETVVGALGEVLYTIDALGNKTTCQYDNDIAAVTSIRSATGRTVHYEYDKDFNITRSIGPDGTATQFAYSVDFGGLERYTDARGQSVAYAYDDKGQGIGNMLADGKGGSLEYNDKGDIISTTDRGGRNRTMEYDAQGRLIRSTDADNRSQELVYDANGNVVKLKDSLQGDTLMTYTAQERLKSITYADGRGFSYEYDDYGRTVKQTFSDGFVQNYEYDALGRVSRMTDKNSNLLVGLEYDAVTGLLLSKTFGNGTSVHYAYDLNGNLLSITHKGRDGSVLETFQYTYDADGRRTQVESSEGVETYTYDLAGQLTAGTYPDGTTESFQYDAVGNRVSANGEVYTVNELNQYLTTGNVVFTYDDNGNMASRTDVNGTTTYEYDAKSRLVRVVRPDGKVWSCEYDALGNRTQVNDNGQIRKQMYTLGSLPSLAAEYNASGKLIRRYILLGSTLIADVDSSGNYRYYHADDLGSTRLLTNDAGTVVSRQSYNTFGGLRTTSGEKTRFGFVGVYGVEVDATGLVFMRHRYYDVTIGRFAQMDPIGLQGKDVNWYRYCDNNGVNLVDVMGTSFLSFCRDYGNAVIEVTTSGYRGTKRFAIDYGNAVKEVVSYYTEGEGFEDFKNLGRGIWAGVKSIPAMAALLLWHDPNAIKFGTVLAINAVGDAVSWGTSAYNYDENGLVFASVSGMMDVFALGGELFEIGKTESIWKNVNVIKAPFDIVFNLIDAFNKESMKKEITNISSFVTEPTAKEIVKISSPKSEDPNEMVGPIGFGNEKMERFVTPGEWLSYTINFENKSSATAAAQEVFVDAQLSEYLDWSTFEIGSIFFSNQTELGLMGRQRGKILVNRQNTNQKVQIEVTMNASTGKVRWYLRSYDPDTTDHWPASVYDGFLPPNDDNHAGEGSLTYRIKVKDDAPHNARIDASAEIIFDTNAMIPTDPAWFNTIYAMAPQDDFDPSLPDGTAMLQLDSLGWGAVAGASEYDVTLWKVVNGKDELVGSATGLKMGYWDISNYAESDSPGTTYHWQIVARNNLGSKTSNVYSFRTLGADEQAGYALRPGWNLIAVPFEIEAENGGSELLSMSPIVYERLYNVYARATESMKSGTAAWLFSRETKSIRIWTDKGLQGEPKLPPELSSGWNLTGICGTQELLLDCEAEGVSAIWTWNGRKFTAVPIENGAALLEPGVGYWLYLDK